MTARNPGIREQGMNFSSGRITDVRILLDFCPIHFGCIVLLN